MATPRIALKKFQKVVALSRGMVLYSNCPKGTKRKAPTMTRYANPYFVRATIEFVGMTCYDTGDVKTIVKAFETKRDAWNYVQRLIEAYDRDCGGYDNEAYLVELKVQQNWKTLWQY